MNARVYVGTYAKYNSGSIAGQWLNLDDYSDREGFYEACKALHANESDPELMFQDFEGFPRAYWSESNILADVWDWLELDESDRELLAVYQDHVDQNGTIDQARDAFMATADNESDWAATWLEESGMLEDCPKHLVNYIDYEAYARDARLGGGVVFAREEGTLWVFSNN